MGKRVANRLLPLNHYQNSYKKLVSAVLQFEEAKECLSA